MRLDGPVYYGCWRRVGHLPFAPGMRHLPGLDQWVFDGLHLDGGFCPPKSARRHRNGEDEPEGEAKLTLVQTDDGPATILSFWDNSVDRRGNSHSTFVLPGDLDFGDALDAARDAFPEVFDRFDFVVVPYQEA